MEDRQFFWSELKDRGLVYPVFRGTGLVPTLLENTDVEAASIIESREDFVGWALNPWTGETCVNPETTSELLRNLDPEKFKVLFKYVRQAYEALLRDCEWTELM